MLRFWTNLQLLRKRWPCFLPSVKRKRNKVTLQNSLFQKKYCHKPFRFWKHVPNHWELNWLLETTRNLIFPKDFLEQFFNIPEKPEKFITTKNSSKKRTMHK